MNFMDAEAYKRGIAQATEVMEQGRRDLEAQAAEEAAERGNEITYEQKMNALRHNLRKERLEREARTGFKDGTPISWSKAR